VAVEHDGRQTVSMLVRRDGETVAQLLTRVDLAIAKAGVDEVNSKHIPPNVHQILNGHLRNPSGLSTRSPPYGYESWRAHYLFPRPARTNQCENRVAHQLQAYQKAQMFGFQITEIPVA